MIAITIVRLFQLLFSIIVLALSIVAVRWQVYGKAPASTGYNAFAGAWATLFTLIGLVAVFVSSVPGIIVAALDALTFIFLLAGGIAYAVMLKGTSCSNSGDFSSGPITNGLINGGSYANTDGQVTYPIYGIPIIVNSDSAAYDSGVIKSHCNTIVADDVFLFLACITSLAAAVLALMAHRRGGTRHSAV